MDLSIITATIPERKHSLQGLVRQLKKQIKGLPVEHIIVGGDGTIGRKINTGLRASTGKYVCVVDDDDRVSYDYISSLLEEIDHDPDVVTFGVQIPSQPPWWLRFGAKGDDYDIKLANHLCAWKREIALRAPCLPRNYGWDVVWYRALRAGFPNLLESHIPRVLYHYYFSREGTRAQSLASVADSIDNNGAEIDIVRIYDGRIAAGPSIDRMWVANMEKIDLTTAERTEYIDRVVFT